MFARPGLGQGSCTLAIRQDRAEPFGRAIIVIVIERVMERRERKRDKERETSSQETERDEPRQAQPAAHFVGSPCRRGPTCPYLRRRCCLFFHPEDETASASGVGQDLPSFVSLMERIARLELEVAQFVGLLVPQIMKELVDGVQSAPQEPNQECRDSADAVRRQGCHDGNGHQQGGRSACGVAATGFSDGVEDRGSPAVAVHRQFCVASVLSDQPDDQACRNSAVFCTSCPCCYSNRSPS